MGFAHAEHFQVDWKFLTICCLYCMQEFSSQLYNPSSDNVRSRRYQTILRIIYGGYIYENRVPTASL